MPKRKPIENLPLFADMADADQRRGFKTDDEREFERQQARRKKRKFVPLSKAPATGPACVRCKNWLRPTDGDEFGECRHLVVTLKEAPWASAPAGTITDRETARKDWYVDFDYLRTGEAFTCSAYKHVADAEAA